MADQHGLLAVGGDLEVESLLLAYRSGIFPWPIDEEILAWFSPPRRGVIFFDQLHISKSLVKERRRSTLRFEVDTAFREVLEGCARAGNRKHQQGTWITPAMIDAYVELHAAGFAHSIEAFRDQTLVGGIYGVSIGAMFAAESMFYAEPNASKLCLWQLVEHLAERGATWLDCQVLTPTTEHFGAVEVPRARFLKLVGEAIDAPIRLF